MKQDFQYQRAKINGLKIGYWHKKGSKPAVIFLHGLANNGRSWVPTINKLALAENCFLLDLPGFGHSQSLSGEISFTALSFFLADFLKKNKLRKVVLIGASMGSLLVLEFANHFPELIEKIVLLAPPAKLKKTKPKQLFKFFFGLAKKHLLFGFFLKTILSYRISSYGLGIFLMKKFNKKIIDEYGVEGKRLAKPETWFSLGVAAVDFQTFKKIKFLNIPSLILVGDSDRLIDQKMLQEVVSTNLQTELSILSEAGHVLHLEKPLEVAQKISKFLKT